MEIKSYLSAAYQDNVTYSLKIVNLYKTQALFCIWNILNGLMKVLFLNITQTKEEVRLFYNKGLQPS